jgi:diguanylate cyclase (GGDEF)-like protein
MRDSSFDYMTKIWNRRSLEREFQRLWRDASRRKKTISVLFIDIDRFKEFNDSYGHEAGDRVLRATARVIERSMSRPLDLCCRWGGEEFLAVLPETSAEEARAVAERIRERIRIMKLRLKCTSLPQITLSIGIAASRTDAIGSPDELIARADKALLLAKEQGRDQVFIG